VLYMSKRKKRQDKLVAGFLAILTAFSPVVSVVPVYGSVFDGNAGSSITMDPDSVTVDETGSGSIVLDNSDDSSAGINVIEDDNQSSNDITIGDDNQSGDDITIEDDNPSNDGITIGDDQGSQDGIDTDNSDEGGIDIQEPDSDGISITDIYDGIDIEEYDAFEFRKQLGVVIQETFLFSGTILDNIRYGNPKATNEEIIEAAKIARAHDFIVKKPFGYDTKLGNKGSGLSGGEKQRIAIARAILNKPNIFILDEALLLEHYFRQQKFLSLMK